MRAHVLCRGPLARRDGLLEGFGSIRQGIGLNFGPTPFLCNDYGQQALEPHD